MSMAFLHTAVLSLAGLCEYQAFDTGLNAIDPARSNSDNLVLLTASSNGTVGDSDPIFPLFPVRLWAGRGSHQFQNGVEDGWHASRLVSGSLGVSGTYKW